MSANQEHYDKYEAKALAIGVPYLRGLVKSIASRETLASRYEADANLNNIPLVLWDDKDPQVRRAAGANGIRAWSLCETVCTLKHVAIHHVLNVPKPE